MKSKMKKFIYTVMVCILIVNVSISQTLITTIKTPKGYTVPDTYDMSSYGLLKSTEESIKTDMSPSELSAVQKYAAIAYTDADLISGPTILYNCHSFAWNISEKGPNC
jgi:hypothetical protein